MFCTKCGKELYPGDRFCAYCGAEVRNREKPKYEEIVFNPPFKIEAEKKTQEILKAAAQPPEEPKPKKTQPAVFDWDLDGFPAVNPPKKTEDVDFNWESVLERRNLSRTQEINVEKIRAAQREHEKQTPQEAQPADPVQEPKQVTVPLSFTTEPAEETKAPEDVVSIEELERELFGSEQTEPKEAAAPEVTRIVQRPEPAVPEAQPIRQNAAQPQTPAEPQAPAAEPKKTDDRFYTYHQKTEAFEELLNKEKERIRELEESYSRSAPNLDYTWVPEVFPQRQKTQPEDAEKTEKAEPAVEVVQPATPKTIDLTLSISLPDDREEPEQKAEAAAQGELPPSKTKLRYSDVFPRIDLDDGPGDDRSAGDDREAQKEETAPKPALSYEEEAEDEALPKKHIFAKIVIALLILLIAAEGVIIGVKFFAPESAFSVKINEILTSVMDRFSGGAAQDDENLPTDDVDTTDTYYEQLVNEAAADMTTIGQAQYNGELRYAKNRTYSFAEIPDTTDFTDMEWTKDADGNPVSYGKALIDAVVRYYDGWQSTNNDKTLVGINELEIGEIRVGAEGFYVLCKVTFAGADGQNTVRYQSIYARASQDIMVINTVKEETL